MLDNARLIHLLRTVPSEEQRQLSRFVDSPIYNTNEKVKKLLVILRRFSPDFKNIPKNKVYESLFGEKIGKKELSKDQSRNLNGIMNRLSRVVEEFLVFQKFNERKILKKRLLIQSLFDRKALEVGKSVLKSAKDELAENNTLEWHRYYEDFLVYESEMTYNHLTAAYKGEVGFQAVLDSFKHFSISGLMRFYCGAISRASIVNKEYDLPLLTYLERYIDESDDGHVPATLIYYYLIKLSKGDSESSFDQLTDLLRQEGHRFPKVEQRQIYRLIQNFCIFNARAGKLEYRAHLFQMYEDTLDLNIWDEKAAFKKETFLHIVKNALSLNRIEWVENFIENYHEKLHKDGQRETLLLAKAYLQYAKKEYDEANSALYEIGNTQSVPFNLYIRKLEIMITYDALDKGAHERKIEALKACISKLRFYLDPNRRRNPSIVSEKTLNAYLDFHNIIMRVFRQKFEAAEIKTNILNNIREDLSQLEIVEEHQWLLEKIKELE